MVAFVARYWRQSLFGKMTCLRKNGRGSEIRESDFGRFLIVIVGVILTPK